nr:nitroreductase [Nocardioides perillae]
MARRWSCRAFRDEPVPAETLREVFALAQRTASWCNTQPWQVHLVTGEATARLREALSAHVLAGAPASDLPGPAGYSGVYAERRRESGYALYSALGIDRTDSDGRLAQMLRNFDFFGAPHVAVVTTDREQGVYGAVDCGGYVANLLNAATAHGVATIAQAAIAMYSDFVRGWLGVGDERQVVCAVSLGWADEDHPANGFRTSRASLDDAVTVVE